MMTTEQLLLDFHKGRENVPRIITSIIPVSHIHPETRKRQMAKSIEQGKVQAFEVDGVQGVIQTKEDALTVAATFANYRFLAKNALLSDMAAGLYSMATTGAGLYDVAEIKVRDQVTGLRIICSLDTIRKASFGPLVTDTGRGIDGAGLILKENWPRILEILEGRVPIPRAYASIYRTLPSGEEIRAMIAGYPVTVHRLMTGTTDAVAIDLDGFFFPVKVDGDKQTAKTQFVKIVAGLTSFLQLGKSIFDKDRKEMLKFANPAEGTQIACARSSLAEIGKAFPSVESFTHAILANPNTRDNMPRDGLKEFRDYDVLGPTPNALTARKIILVGQAAYSLDGFAPGICKQTAGDRLNITIKRSAVPDLYPSAYDNATGRYRYTAFSRAVAASGHYFLEAMKATGIEQHLKTLGDVMIPAIYRGAEFPANKNQVYLKADYLSRLLP